jgi:hypothetical protein
MNWKKGIISGIAAGVVILIVGMASGFLFSADYSSTPQLWKPMTGDWWYYMIALDLLEGILYGIVFTMLYNGIPGKGWRKGLNYGIILWVVATIPGMLMTYLTMTVPDTIVVAWTFGGLIALILAGPAIAVVHDKIK